MNSLSKISDKAKSIWNLVVSFGPYLVSQSELASEAYARHLERLGAVEAGKELILQEVRTFGEIKKNLMEKMLCAEPLEKLRIQQDLKEVSASIRQLNIRNKALDYLPPENQDNCDSMGKETPIEEAKGEIAAHWMDKFSDLARTHNEPWREDLLAQVLAAEASSPGKISTRALWLIGTLEEDVFNAFSTLLDLTCRISFTQIIPDYETFSNHEIPQCSLGSGVTINKIIYLIGTAGLLANPDQTVLTVGKNGSFKAAYNENQFVINGSLGGLAIRGILMTELGVLLASFYQPKFNPLGAEIFQCWLSGLNKAKYAVLKFDQQKKAEKSDQSGA